MFKTVFERTNDNYINLFKEWIFIKWIEHSAMILNKEFWYKLIFSLDKKNNVLLLEAWFPYSKKDEIIAKLQTQRYSIRYIENNETSLIEWNQEIEKNKETLIDLKKWMIKFY